MVEPLTILAITTAKPGMAAALRAVQEQLVAETLKEEGYLSYAFHQSLNEEHVRIFIESWASEALWRAHMDGAAMHRRHFRHSHPQIRPEASQVSRRQFQLSHAAISRFSRAA